MKVYIAGPISGCTAEEVFAYFDNMVIELKEMGLEPYSRRMPCSNCVMIPGCSQPGH